MFNFQIGAGTGATGSISSIDWSADDYFIKVEFDAAGGSSYTELSTTQLVSVPFSLFANDVLNDAVDDADADATNEIQMLSINNDMLEISGGNSVDLTSYISEDNDTTNELISGATLNGTSLEITDAGGVMSVELSSLVDDADADATNELQDLTLSNDTIYISQGNSVVLPPPPGVGGSNTEMLFNNNGTEDGSNLLYNTTNGVLALNAPPEADYNLYIYRPSSSYGADKTGIYGYRNGTSGSTNGGANWEVDGIDAGIKGYSYWGNQYTAGVAGYSYFDYANSAGVFGGDEGASFWGALGFYNGSSTYAGYFSGNVGYTGTLSSVSDQRFKTNIEPLAGALEMVNAVDVKTYEYKSGDEFKDMNLAAGKQYGFIAQQLETVVPELVSSDFATTQGGERMGKDGSTEVKADFYKTVNYIGMIPILTQAIKEQQALIESLEQRIQQLEAE